MFKITEEQSLILSTIQSPDCSLLKISSVAGSGKTATLVQIAKTLPIKHGLYIAFNKSIAEEAKLKFPYTIECRTLHSLAWTFVIKGTKRSISDFTVACITEDLGFEDKQTIIEALDKFFTSSSTSYAYFATILPKRLIHIATKYVEDMVDAKIPCTFNFTLKYFHLMLSHKEITLPIYDVLMLDEAGDTTGVSLEIFKLIQSPKKVMVGDPDQNIYTFMNTINGFEELKNEGVLLTLSQSFRVSTKIAKRVEHFCRLTLNPNMQFKGIDFPEQPIKTMAYLARTNSGLISRMMRLVDTGTPFNLLRSVDEIFELPKYLIMLSPKAKFVPHKFKYIFNEYMVYSQHESLQLEYKHPLSYLASVFSTDVQLNAAIKLIRAHGKDRIFDTYNAVKAMPKRTSPITLATIHVAKGREWDEVYIEDDLNQLIQTQLRNGYGTEEELTEYRLAYVACTRGRLKLSNATFL